MNLINPIQENIPTSWTGPSQNLNKEDTRPNVILILADDMGYNDISLHNGGAADGTLRTPHIDSLAKVEYGFPEVCCKCNMCTIKSFHYDWKISNKIWI